MKRNNSFDILRVISIVLVIIIHITNIYLIQDKNLSNNYFISLFFNSFSRICVPLFFMISGALLIDEKFDMKKYFKRIMKFIFILIIWSLIYYYSNEEHEEFNKVLFNSLFNSRLTSRHLWFMYAIIGIYIALPFIQGMVKNMNRETEKLFIILWIIFCGSEVIYLPIFSSIK